jgi:hypothetical protein
MGHSALEQPERKQRQKTHDGIRQAQKTAALFAKGGRLGLIQSGGGAYATSDIFSRFIAVFSSCRIRSAETL